MSISTNDYTLHDITFYFVLFFYLTCVYPITSAEPPSLFFSRKKLIGTHCVTFSCFCFRQNCLETTRNIFLQEQKRGLFLQNFNYEPKTVTKKRCLAAWFVLICSVDIYQMTGEVGSYRYMAPELVRHEPYNAKADIYSWAILSWEVLSVSRPYTGITESSFIKVSLAPVGVEQVLLKTFFFFRERYD